MFGGGRVTTRSISNVTSPPPPVPPPPVLEAEAPEENQDEEIDPELLSQLGNTITVHVCC